MGVGDMSAPVTTTSPTTPKQLKCEQCGESLAAESGFKSELTAKCDAQAVFCNQDCAEDFVMGGEIEGGMGGGMGGGVWEEAWEAGWEEAWEAGMDILTGTPPPGTMAMYTAPSPVAAPGVAYPGAVDVSEVYAQLPATVPTTSPLAPEMSPRVYFTVLECDPTHTLTWHETAVAVSSGALWDPDSRRWYAPNESVANRVRERLAEGDMSAFTMAEIGKPIFDPYTGEPKNEAARIIRSKKKPKKKPDPEEAAKQLLLTGESAPVTTTTPTTPKQLKCEQCGESLAIEGKPIREEDSGGRGCRASFASNDFDCMVMDGDSSSSTPFRLGRATFGSSNSEFGSANSSISRRASFSSAASNSSARGGFVSSDSTQWTEGLQLPNVDLAESHPAEVLHLGHPHLFAKSCYPCGIEARAQAEEPRESHARQRRLRRLQDIRGEERAKKDAQEQKEAAEEAEAAEAAETAEAAEAAEAAAAAEAAEAAAVAREAIRKAICTATSFGIRMSEEELLVIMLSSMEEANSKQQQQPAQ
jgi:hypothetical protein